WGEFVNFRENSKTDAQRPILEDRSSLQINHQNARLKYLHNKLLGSSSQFVREHGTLMSTEATIEEKTLRKKSFFLQALWLVLAGLLFIVGLLLVAWAAGALYFDLPASAPVRKGAAIFWVVAAAVLGLFGGSRGRALTLIAF